MYNKKRGIFMIICSAFFFALMAAFVRLAGDLPSTQKSFFRNLIALIFALIVLLKQNNGFLEKKENIKYLFLRSAAGTVGILCHFYAIDHLVLSDASMLNKLSPFFAIIFSYFLLKEKITLVQAGAVITAFIGSLFIIKPGFRLDVFPALMGILGGLGAGAAYAAVRLLSKRGERGAFIIFFFSAFSCVVTLPFMLFGYKPMSISQLLILLMAGLCASGGQFCITAAYSSAPASEISVYDYSQIIFAAVIGYFLFDQMPDIFSVIGYVIIFSVAMLMFFYKSSSLKEAK